MTTTTFKRSDDYALIRELLIDAGMRPPAALEVGPTPRIDYIVAREGSAAVALFLLVDGVEVHFCFRRRVWGRSDPIARAFLAWVWASTPATRLVGPVPIEKRLVLRLARLVGFTEFAAGSNPELVLLEIRKPCNSD